MIKAKLIKMLLIYLILVAVIVMFTVGFGMLRYRYFFRMPFPHFGLNIVAFPLFAAVGLAVLFVWIGIGIAVYYDAKQRGMEPLLWALVAALVPYFLGLIAYLIVRHPIQVVCSVCGHPFTAADIFCRNCGRAVQAKCSACGQAAAATARFCPHCGTPLAAPPAPATS